MSLAYAVAYSSVNDVYERATITGEFMIEYSPAGRISIQITTIGDERIGEMSVNGTCQVQTRTLLRKLLDNETATSPYNPVPLSITCICASTRA